jgi:hypothetical protein
MPVKRNVARSTLPVIPALVAAAEAEAQALAAASAAATSSSSSTSKVQFASSVDQLWRSYVDTSAYFPLALSRALQLTRGAAPTAPKNLKLLDTLQLFLMLTGVVQFAYCVLVTNYPFNAFLGGCVQSTRRNERGRRTDHLVSILGSQQQWGSSS